MKRILKKTGKILLYTFIAFFLSINAFILLSGRLYMYKALANTYLVGKSGPTIYDNDAFYNATIKGTNKEEWTKDKKFNSQFVPVNMREYIESLGTKAFLVFKGDTLLYEEYWGDHTDETVSNSFSMSKTLVAILVGIAIEEGKIEGLDVSASLYLPEFRNDERKKITIRHLLTMSSGLDWSESGKNPLSDNAESYYGWGLRELVTNQKLIDEPGKTFKYQSGNTELLGYIVEKATGKDLTKYAEDKIWSKIGANDNAFWSLDKEGGDEKAFCCIYATARDYARIGSLLLHKGKIGNEQIIPKWFYDEMIVPAEMATKEGIPNTRYGLHIWTYFGKTNPVYYCRGIKGQYIITIPKENLTIVRLGSDRIPSFEIPDQFKNDEDYIRQNQDEIGHAPDFFQYIALGKMIKSQTEF
ncbi:MAG: serine hydrolase [Crocinitomicaceae bacterium]|nr:beta-lactamase family protein [Flavobacteriales bacterium]NQZ34700.1 serine hydrolase [Crocinitomicaceae bacterium]